MKKCFFVPLSAFVSLIIILLFSAASSYCAEVPAAQSNKGSKIMGDKILPISDPRDTVVPEYTAYDPGPLLSPRKVFTPFDLRLEYRENPLGIDLAHRESLRVSWKVPLLASSNEAQALRSRGQSAYQIKVAREDEAGTETEVWDSGRISSDHRNLVPLNFQLQSKTLYKWQVRVWDDNGELSPWSQPASFETGLLNQQEWEKDQAAKWITSSLVPPQDEFVDYWHKAAMLDIYFPKGKKTTNDKPKRFKEPNEIILRDIFGKMKAPVYFRKEFTLNEVPKRARLYISGMGYHQPYINGHKLGDFQMAPTFVNYDQRAMYQVFDCTEYLKQGGNALGSIVALGRFNEIPSHSSPPNSQYGFTPTMIARLEISYADGTRDLVVSDTSWQAGLGAYRRTHFWAGEAYDATREPKGWSESGFQERWVQAELSKMIPEALEADRCKPVKANFMVKPVKRENPMPGVWVYDFGKMIVGKAQVKFDLPRGATARIRYADITYGDTSEWKSHGGTFFGDYPEAVMVNDPKTDGMIMARHRGTIAQRPHLEDLSGEKNVTATAGYADAYRSDGSPHFYLGGFDFIAFRYIEISTLETPPDIKDVSAVAIYSPLEVIGKLTIHDEALQRVHDACLNSLMMLTHANHHDNAGAERNVGASGTVSYLNWDLAFYTAQHARILNKMNDDNRLLSEKIGIPVSLSLTKRDVVKKNRNNFNVNNNESHVGRPLRQALYFGDLDSLHLNLNQAKLFFDHFFNPTNNIERENLGGSSTHWDSSSAAEVGNGKWVNQRMEISTKGRHLTDQTFGRACFLLLIAKQYEALCQMAAREDLWKEVKPKVDHYRKWVMDTYYEEKSERFSTIDNLGDKRLVIQDTGVFTIKGGLLDEQHNQAIVDEFVQNMRTVTHNYNVSGLKTIPWHFELLSHYGYNEEALRLLKRTEYPSLGAMLTHTGWTVAETWGRDAKQPLFNSYVQIEGCSSVANWFYKEMVGIRPDIKEPGFKKFYLMPIVTETSPDYKFAFESPQGMIASEFTRRNGKTTWQVVVPPNTQALIVLPVGKLGDWRESGKSLNEAKGVTIGGTTSPWIQPPQKLSVLPDRPALTVSSGIYRFEMHQ
jgi:alpha-L-rhamnosidase